MKLFDDDTERASIADKVMDGGLHSSEEWGDACDEVIDNVDKLRAAGLPDTAIVGLWSLFADRMVAARQEEENADV